MFFQHLLRSVRRKHKFPTAKSKYLHKRIISFLSAKYGNFDINVFLSTVITPNILSMPSETSIRKNNTEKNGDPGKWITESENAIKARPDPI